MNRHHLKHATFVALRGVLLTSLAVILQWGGYLARLESGLYDERIIHCQEYRPPPEKSLVHLDVDDNALNYIGHWPWHPNKLARIIKEIALTQPKVMALDVIFAEPFENNAAGVNEDQELANAFTQLGCAVIPVSLKFENPPAPSKAHELLLPFLIKDPEQTQVECGEFLKSHGISTAELEGNPDDSFFSVRDQAFYERMWQEVSTYKDSEPGKEELKHKILPHLDPLTRSVTEDIFDLQYDKVMRERVMQRFMLASPQDHLPLLRASEETAPILCIGEAAAHTGFVDYLPESVEGTVRSVPLVVQYRDHRVLQMGLVTACAEMGVDINTIRLGADSITIPRPGKKDVIIPLSVRNSTSLGSVGMLMEVPLFGRKGNWLTMYDFPRYEKQAQHVSIYEVWRICEAVDKLQNNHEFLHHSLVKTLSLIDESAANQYANAPPTGDKEKQLIQDTLDGPNGIEEIIKGMASSEAVSDPSFKKTLDGFNEAARDLRQVVAQNDELQRQVAELRASLRDKLHDKAMFMGGTATSLSDLRPTSLFGSSPGVIVHGAVFNAILTGKLWRVDEEWHGYLITTVLGLLTLLLIATLSPLRAFFGSITLATGYLAINGYYLFAHENLVVAAAGPLVAIGLVYSGMTLFSRLTEKANYSRIEKRFSSYVDPVLVKFMVEHPEHVRFDGETLEVTTCFSDLAGFTTLTDQMGEKIVPLLSEYMGEMIPVIRQYNGYVSQMAGDGIYFLFGAPQVLPNHAELALSAGFGMYQALAAFNVTLKQRGLSQLGMRIGMSTGEVIVGDTGSKEVRAYTAMGATVNLSSRLESANKVFGSRMLITNRTVELLNGRYLVRPLANLQVAGKLNCVVVSEPLCLISQATDADKRLADYTTRVFEAYRVANFNRCIAAATELEEAFGASKFTKLYTRLSTEHLNRTAPIEHYEGQIVLTEK